MNRRTDIGVVDGKRGPQVGVAVPLDATDRGKVLLADGTVWMGPGPAPTPTGPETEKPRVFDYLTGLNIQRSPENIKKQETGGFTFQQLRALAEQTVVNGAIYKAAEKVKKVEFTFAVVAQPGESKKDAQARGDKDPRITELRKFFESPDKDREWPEWISDAWVQILTCDNLSIYRWPFDNYGSGVDRPGAYAIDIIDGDRIQPLIDDAGRVPRDLDADAYIQWTKGQPRKAFNRRKLLYAMCWPSAQRVMGRSPVERLWFYLNVALRRDLTKLDWYTEGNIPAGLWPVDTEHWTPADLEKGQDFIDAVTHGKKRSKLILIPSGDGNPIFPAEKSMLDPFDDWLTRLACFFIGIPISSLIQEQNRATAENSRDAADEEGELPRIDFTRRLLNKIVRLWWGYEDIVALPKRDVEIDAAIQAEIDDLGIRNGSKQVDEVRQRNGDVPLGLPPGYMSTTGYVPFGTPAETAGDVEDPALAAALLAAGDQTPQQPADVALQIPNGAQIASATAIVTAVASGIIPRDSGLGQLRVLFKLAPEEAELMMGSAGMAKVPTTPNPRPDLEPDPAPVAPPAKVPVAEVEKAAPPFDYASTQVNLTGNIAGAVLALAGKIPDSALAEKGRETHPHVTVKYGIHRTVSAAEVAEALDGLATGRLTLGKTAHFATEAYDVVYVAVTSPDLGKMNAAIAGGVACTSTQSSYVPHVTLAYVKAGSGAAYDGDATLDGTEVEFSSIHYSGPDGVMTEIALGEGDQKKTLNDAQKAADPDLSAVLKIILADDDELRKLARKYHIKGINAGAFQVGELIGIDTLISIENTRVVEFLAEKGNQIVSVNATTADRINTAILRMVADGETPEAIGRAVRDAFDVRHSDAIRIGRQEVGSGLNGGRNLQMLEEGIAEQQWITSRDTRVRDTHVEMDGEIAKVGGTFSNGLAYPQDPAGPASETIGCRCITLPVLDSAKSIADEVERARRWRTASRVVKPIAKEMTKELQALFESQRDRVLKALIEEGIAA